MATLTVWKYESPDGAEKALSLLGELSKQRLIEVQDAAIVSWPRGARKPKTRHLANLTGAGALDGAFWGMLFGWIFFVPFLGAAFGAAMGALAGHFSDYGIGKEFIENIRKGAIDSLNEEEKTALKEVIEAKFVATDPVMAPAPE